MNISKGLQTAALIAALGGAVYVWGWCRYRAGAQEAILQAAGDTTDQRVARLAADQLLREAAWARTQKRQNQEIAGIRHRADSLARALASRVIVVGGDSLIPKPAVDSLVAAKDSLFANSERRAAFWQSKSAWQDSMMSDLTLQRDQYRAQRDSWRHKAQPGLLRRLAQDAPWLAGAWLLGRTGLPK